MRHLFAIIVVGVVTGTAPGTSPAIAGSSSLDELNACINGPRTVARCLHDYYRLEPARSKRVAACMLRHGSDGKSVTAKQWVACGLPKEDTKV